MKNILEAIPALYKKNKSGKYYSEFTDVYEAVKFAEGIKNQLKQLGFIESDCKKLIEHRMGKVYMDIDTAKKIYEVENEICEVMSV